MVTDLSSLLAEASNYSPDTPEYESWSDARVSEFNVTAVTTLDCLEIERFEYPENRGHEFRLRSRDVIDDESVALIHLAWRATGGIEAPSVGLSRLAVASAEIVRAQLHSVLWIASRLEIYRRYRPEAAERFLNLVESIDWHNSKAVIQANFQVMSVLGVVESAADNLYNWTANVDRVSGEFTFLRRSPAAGLTPVVTQGAILAGAALLWVDAALASPDRTKAIGLMACASNGMWQSGFMSGWEGREDMLRDEAKHAGRKGGELRHKASRELKLWALAEAQSMRGSDIEIARSLARRIPSQFEVASADPERLIYDALRAVSAKRRADRVI